MMDIANVVFNHQVSIQIRFNDIDALRHVNNTVYFNYCDFGRVAYFEAVRRANFDLTKSEFVIASIKMDFLNPTFFHESIVVKTKIYTVGSKSFKMIQTIENSEGDVKAICDSVMVGFDGQQSIEISTEMRNLIARFEGSV